VRHYRRAVARKPGLTAIWVQLGHALKEQGDHLGAEAAYRNSLALDGSMADTHLQLGHLLQIQSRWADAGDAYARALRLDPELQQAEDALVALYPQLIAEASEARDAGNWPLAAQHYRRTLDRQPELQSVWADFGHVLREQGEFAAAEAAYRSALALDRSIADPHFQLGETLRLQARFSEAFDAYDTALRLDPGLAMARQAMRTGVGETRRVLPDAPLVSVIIPCYNFEQYLGECIDSVIAQTYLNLEAIIVDDGSIDNSNAVARELVAKYPDTIRHYANDHLGQPAFPRNFGISQSNGEFIICLDGDDKLDPRYVEICVSALQESPSASIAYTDAQSFGNINGILHMVQEYNFKNLLMGDYIPCSAMFKKSMWREVGGYKTHLSGIDDWNFWIEAGKLGHFGVPIYQPLFYHRSRPDSMYTVEVLPVESSKRSQLILHNSDVYDIETVKTAAVFLLNNGGDAGNANAQEIDHGAFLAVMKRIFRPRTYIEVGIRQGATLLSEPVPEFVVGIDPEPALTGEAIRGCRNLLIMRSKSEDALAELFSGKFLGERQSDFTVLQGTHHCEVVLRDIANCARLSRDGALIFVHDVLPGEDLDVSREPRPDRWVGDVYKVVPTIWRFLGWIPTLLVGDIPPSGMLILRVTGDIHSAIFNQHDAMVTAMESLELEPALDEMRAKAVSRASPAFADFIVQALEARRSGL
jgi:glycosyltransferase involved in cell wall biosynthesis/cytochrome c-type biogenesis protein CcmH/NrfG